MLLSLFNKVADLMPVTLLKKKLQQRCSTVNFAKFLKTPFFTEHFRWLLLTLELRTIEHGALEHNP